MPEPQDPLKEAQVCFGRNLRALRLARGLSQKAFGALARKKGSYVGAVERGERNIGVDQIDELAMALGVDLVELFDQSMHSL